MEDVVTHGVSQHGVESFFLNVQNGRGGAFFLCQRCLSQFEEASVWPASEWCRLLRVSLSGWFFHLLARSLMSFAEAFSPSQSGTHGHVSVACITTSQRKWRPDCAQKASAEDFLDDDDWKHVENRGSGKPRVVGGVLFGRKRLVNFVKRLGGTRRQVGGSTSERLRLVQS